MLRSLIFDQRLRKIAKIRVNLISDVEADATQEPESLPVTEKAALDQSQKFEQHRDFREAIRSLYLAVLLQIEAYDLQLSRAGQSLTVSTSLQPLFEYPPVEYILSLTEQEIRSARSAVAPLFGVGRTHSVITFRAGRGRVFALSCTYIFTNRGLGEAENAKFIHNLLTYLPENAMIRFDEYHHGF